MAKPKRIILANHCYFLTTIVKDREKLLKDDTVCSIVLEERDFKKRIDYIHKNPLISGLVQQISDYPYSSFRNYYFEDDSLIKIDKLLW